MASKKPLRPSSSRPRSRHCRMNSHTNRSGTASRWLGDSGSVLGPPRTHLTAIPKPHRRHQRPCQTSLRHGIQHGFLANAETAPRPLQKRALISSSISPASPRTEAPTAAAVNAAASTGTSADSQSDRKHFPDRIRILRSKAAAASVPRIAELPELAFVPRRRR